MNTIHRGAATRTALALLCLTTLPMTANAGELLLHVEPALALWVDDPQSERFTPGGYVAVRPGISLNPVLSLQLGYALLMTPTGPELEGYGSAHFIEGGIRLRPFSPLQPEQDLLGGLFLDFNLGYVRTGTLNRFGFDGGLGYAFQPTPGFALGPVVRYVHIAQPEGLEGVNKHDAQLLTVGLNLSFGGIPKEEPTPSPTPTARTTPAPKPVKAAPCADRDRDSVCDSDDRCPSQGGSVNTAGCPVDPCTGKPLVILVQFPYDSADLPAPTSWNAEPMDPVLDAVAAAISLDPSCRVCIVGNASEEGAASYNQILSADRAVAVQRYLVARGLEKSRLPTRALGETCQVVPAASLEMNRRVEFRRLDEGASCPTTCLE